MGIFPQARLAAPEFVDRVERLDAQDLVPLFVDEPLPQVVRNRLDGFDLAISFLSDPDTIIARNLAAAGVKQVVAWASRMRPDVHAVFQLAEVLGPLGLTLHDPVPRLAVGSKPAPLRDAGFSRRQRFSPKELADRSLDRTHSAARRLSLSDFLLVGGEADDKVVREFRARCRSSASQNPLECKISRICAKR